MRYEKREREIYQRLVAKNPKKKKIALVACMRRLAVQLWHVGRVSDPLFLNGALPEAPSAVRPKGYVSLVRPQKEFVTPRALELPRNSRGPHE